MQGIKVVFVGKTDSREIQALMQDYLKRLSRFISIEIQEVPDVKVRKSLSEEEQKKREGTAILSLLSPNDELILLDERGKEYTSRGFATLMEQKMISVSKRLVFVIGGPYGFSSEVYDACQSKISLSQMTFSHQMVRLFLIEQIYRAFAIINGHPYHHD